MLMSTPRKKLREELSKLAIGRSLSKPLRTEGQRQSAYNSAEQLGIKITTQRHIKNRSITVMRIK